MIIAIKKQLSKLAYYQAIYPKTVLFILLIITAIMVNGAGKVVFSTSNNIKVLGTEMRMIPVLNSDLPSHTKKENWNANR